MARRKPKRKTKKRSKTRIKVNAGTAWFLAILLISVLTALINPNISTTIIWLILAICGAMVAIYNIRFDEENRFLLAVSALFIVILSWSLTGIFGEFGNQMLSSFLINLIVGLGVAGFIVAISLIFKIAIDK